MDLIIDAKKSIFKKTSENYSNDGLFDIIDIEDCVFNPKIIERIDEEQFLYYEQNKTQVSTKEKLISNIHNINVFEVFKEILNNKDNGKGFEVIDFIGEGTFGLVVSAWDLNNKQKKAIKIVPKYKFSKDIKEYLNREVSIQSRVDHKQFTKLYGVLETKDFLCLIMELCEGGSLKDFIVKRYYSMDKPFINEEECSTIINYILKGLDYIYSMNIMHRDIKPGNK